MTQKIRVADEDLATLFRREQELNRRILEGTLDINSVLSDLQKLIEGKSFKSNILQISSSVSLSDRITLGKYDWVNSDITEKNFPDKEDGDYEVEYRIFHFNRSISSESIMAEMEKEGFKPANILELLKLGEIQPNLQKEFPIVALDSNWIDQDDVHNVLIIRSDCGRRILILNWLNYEWDERYRFLGVRKVA
jgi:hypothetical protein